MELNELMKLASEIEKATLKELEARRTLIMEKAGLKELEAKIVSLAYQDGTINGKNAETRKRQEIDILASEELYTDAEKDVFTRQCEADFAAAKLVGLETKASLIKAWLYSQARIA